MMFNFSHTRAAKMAALAYVLTSPLAHADEIGSLHDNPVDHAIDAVADAVSNSSIDPWNTQKKIAVYGNNLRPMNCPPPPAPDHKLMLNETVIAAMCHNPATKASYLGLMGSAATYGANFGAYLPTVSATYGSTRSSSFGPGVAGTTASNTSGLSASMTLYDFGQREATIESAEKTLIASGYSYDSALQGAIAQVIGAYYSLLTAQNALDVQRESERFAKETFDAAHLKHTIGLVPLADELQAKVSYSQSQLATEKAENTLSLAQAALALKMGMPATTSLAVAEMNDMKLMKDPFDGKAEELIEQAKAQRVDLKASRATLEGSKATLRATKRSYLGSVTAGVSGGFDDANPFKSQTTRGHTLTVNVSIPIFNGFRDSYGLRAAELGLEGSELTLKQTELGIEQDVWNSWHNYQTAKQSWDLTWDQVANATLLKDVALGRYKEGLGTILDVLNAQVQYTSALQSQLSTRYALLTSRVDLIRAVGVLNLDNVNPEPPGAETTTPPATSFQPLTD